MKYDEYTHLKWGSVPPILETHQYEDDTYVLPVGMFFTSATAVAKPRLCLTPSSIFAKVLGKTAFGYKKYGTMTQLYRSCAWQLDVPEVLNHNFLLQSGHSFPETPSKMASIIEELGIERIKEMPTVIKKVGDNYDISYRLPTRLVPYSNGQGNYCRRCKCSEGRDGVQAALQELEVIHSELCAKLIEDFNAKRAKK